MCRTTLAEILLMVPSKLWGLCIAQAMLAVTLAPHSHGCTEGSLRKRVSPPEDTIHVDEHDGDTRGDGTSDGSSALRLQPCHAYDRPSVEVHATVEDFAVYEYDGEEYNDMSEAMTWLAAASLRSLLHLCHRRRCARMR